MIIIQAISLLFGREATYLQNTIVQDYYSALYDQFIRQIDHIDKNWVVFSKNTPQMPQYAKRGTEQS